MSAQQNDSYLKSLSKKQYSWMQQASSPASETAPSPEADVRTQSSPTHSTAVDVAELVEPVPEEPVNDPMDISEDLETKQPAEDPSATAQNGTADPGRQRDVKSKSASNPRFKYTSFPVKGFNILPTRNITSQYAKADSVTTLGILAGPDDIKPNVSYIRTISFAPS